MPRVRRLLVLVVVVALGGAGCAAGGRTAGSVTPNADGSTASPTPSDTGGAVAIFEEVPPLHPSVDDWPDGTVEVVAGDGTVHRVAVRLAATAEHRSHGLMEVPELPDGAGMWFVYEQDRSGGFWMKNTLVPLDITYVGADDRIVSIADAEPCEADPCPVYEPGGTYRNVLEVPAGYLDRVGAGVGDVVRLLTP